MGRVNSNTGVGGVGVIVVMDRCGRGRCNSNTGV